MSSLTRCQSRNRRAQCRIAFPSRRIVSFCVSPTCSISLASCPKHTRRTWEHSRVGKKISMRKPDMTCTGHPHNTNESAQFHRSSTMHDGGQRDTMPNQQHRQACRGNASFTFPQQTLYHALFSFTRCERDCFHHNCVPVVVKYTTIKTGMPHIFFV